MAALTFTPSGNGVTAGIATDATTTMVLFRRVLPETDISVEVCETDTPANYVKVFGTRDAINAGEAPESFNLAVPATWFVRIVVNQFAGTPQVVVE